MAPVTQYKYMYGVMQNTYNSPRYHEPLNLHLLHLQTYFNLSEQVKVRYKPNITFTISIYVHPPSPGQMYNPPNYTLKHDTSLNYEANVYRKFADVTAEVCQGVCEELLDDSCCTLVYIRDTNTCYITAVEASVDEGLLDHTAGVDTYLRHKCSGRNFIIYDVFLH